MDKNNLVKSKKYFKLGLTFLIVIILSIIFYRSSENFNLTIIFKNIKSILSPFIYGILIAYILNPALKFIENKLLHRITVKNIKFKRILAITITYICLFSFLFWLIVYIVPEIVESGRNVITFLKDFDINLISIDKLNLPSEVLIEIGGYVNSILSSIISTLVNIPNMLGTIVSSTVGLVSSIFNFILGIVISIYILADKESLSLITKKTLYAFSNKDISEKVIKICYDSNLIFERFFIGKIIDSTIIGIIFFAGATVLSTPFSILLSIIIGVTNMIPYFGPFIGAIPVILITLLADIANPLKSLWIAIFILALQQFDGIILGPKILGNSIGLKPTSIIFSIIVGGAILGAPGMFFGVPIFAVIVSLFTKYIDIKYEQKK